MIHRGDVVRVCAEHLEPLKDETEPMTCPHGPHDAEEWRLRSPAGTVSDRIYSDDETEDCRVKPQPGRIKSRELTGDEIAEAKKRYWKEGRPGGIKRLDAPSVKEMALGFGVPPERVTHALNTKESVSTDAGNGSSRTVELRGGGTVTITASVNVLALSSEDREFLFGLVDKLEEYEA